MNLIVKFYRKKLLEEKRNEAMPRAAKTVTEI